jgi:prepilin-type N-terminal cleavage/methylation domain-containing protein
MPILKVMSDELCVRCKSTHHKSHITHLQNGFTLIELMVTIAIIAILAVMGMSLFTNAQRSARDTKRISDIKEIQKALELYYTTNGSVYPASTNSLNNSTYFASGVLPPDPTSTTPYFYDYNPNCGAAKQGFKLCATMEKSGGNSGEQGNACSAMTAPTSAPGFFCVRNSLN